MQPLLFEDVLLLILFADDGLGSTELGGLDFAGDATLGSSPELPEDPGRESCTDPDWFGSTSLAEVRRCSLSLTSFSRDLALCSARRRSNCFFLPGTALRWLSECVLQVRDLVQGFFVSGSNTPQCLFGSNSLSESLL